MVNSTNRAAPFLLLSLLYGVNVSEAFHSTPWSFGLANSDSNINTITNAQPHHWHHHRYNYHDGLQTSRSLWKFASLDPRDRYYLGSRNTVTSYRNLQSRVCMLPLSVSLVLPPSTMQAASALIISSFVGIQFDKLIPGAGILGTLLSAALASNLGIIPASHALYDLCWSIFLPSSLALLLLGFRSPGTLQNGAINNINTNTGTNNATNPATPTPSHEQPIGISIRTVALPFIIASIFSLLGCTASFLISQSWSSFNLQEAQVTTACLSASLVGGSVNFFATAKLVNAPSSLLGSLATADLMVMAVYFAFLATALKSSFFRNLYQPTNKHDVASVTYSAATAIFQPITFAAATTTIKKSKKRLRFISVRTMARKLFAGTTISSAAIAIVQLANNIERLVIWIPGTACAVIAIIAPSINSFCTDRLEQHDSVGMSSLWHEMQQIAGPVGDLCFHWLFAAIGVGANIQQALVTGPACLFFTSIAVLIHLVGTFLGCKLVQRFIPSLAKHMEIEDVLIASNAAIGGPATAAAFCRGMQGPRVRGWTMAATCWGVVGYAIGTSIGVGMFRLAKLLS